ncbi:MAG: methyltransferase domain-containing protein [Promethearchaeota archaeon]
MASQNSWLNGSNDPKKAREIVEFLEARSKYPDQIIVNSTLKDVLNPQKGERLLEVGSGSGVLSRLMVNNLSPGGLIIGIDKSPEIVKLSRHYALEHNLNNSIDFKVDDARNLDYPDRFFDGAFAARLLLYISNPLEVINELVRVVKPGGRIVLMDWDFETLVLDHSNRELTRRIFHWRNDNKDGNNWSGRQLYRLLKFGGLKEVTIYPVVTIALDDKSSLTQTLWHAASNTLEQGIITTEEYESWVSEVRLRIKMQQYFASIVYFIAHGIVP